MSATVASLAGQALAASVFSDEMMKACGVTSVSLGVNIDNTATAVLATQQAARSALRQHRDDSIDAIAFAMSARLAQIKEQARHEEAMQEIDAQLAQGNTAKAFALALSV